MVRYLEGTPIRKLANQLQINKDSLYRLIKSSLLKVPNSNHISDIICKHFQGILQVDGKYLYIKGFDRKIPLLWCIDYYSHDILFFMLAPSENYQAYVALFTKLKNLHYPLQYLICDEHEAITQAIKYVFPKVKIQLCINHYKESVRRVLRSRTNEQHQQFVRQIEKAFKKKDIVTYSKYLRHLLSIYSLHPIYRGILLDMNRKHEYLTRYLVNRKVPATNNLIEAYNSHLEARVRSMKGFQSYANAELWLNAYIMNRRLTKFTDCGKRFRKLNGTCSLAHTAMYDAPNISLLKIVK